MTEEEKKQFADDSAKRVQQWLRLDRRMRRFAWKWMWCIIFHRQHRCVPRDVWWHCEKCHPCGEGFDILLGKNEEEDDGR